MLNKAVIDLCALRENAIKIKKSLPKTTKFCAVVKAEGYGHGGVEVANALYSIADCYAVAIVEEGIELRYAGIDKEILVLGRAIKDDYDLAAEFELTLTVTNALDVKKYNSAGARLNKTVRAHVKYNAGMNRQGADDLDEMKKIINCAKNLKFIKISGIYSHYSCPQKPKILQEETQNFLRARNLMKSYDKNITAHVSASGGFLSGKYFDMVRIGILLYGYKPYKTDKIEVAPIMKVYAPILNKRRLSFNQGALYGLKKTKRAVSLSLIRYGYADGLNRNSVKGQFSNRCMDITAVISDKGYGEFYNVLTDADKLAKRYKTISYEILTKVAMRAEKIYIK